MSCARGKVPHRQPLCGNRVGKLLLQAVVAGRRDQLKKGLEREPDPTPRGNRRELGAQCLERSTTGGINA